MCGIAGFFSSVLTNSDLKTATSSLQHRGPDGEGLFIADSENYKIGLGHRRLSIIDLSKAASQPMESHCGRYTMIFNGEIYNYNEIKQKYFPGYQWKSTGDSEVIVESFAKYGSRSFSWFNGMFAIAIWDKETSELTLARDHIGIKPFYYFFDGTELIFASELKAITSIKKKVPVDYSVIPSYLHAGYIPHPFSIYKDVWKLSAGSFAVIKQAGKNSLSFAETSFWKIQDKISSTSLITNNEAISSLDTLLSDAVQKQLISDVPIGTFLSGGTDSSIVTALAAKVSASKINTYSIAVTDGKVNEAPYAAAVAKHIGTNHHELPITQKEILEMVPSFMLVYDEPFTDSSAFPTMLVSKLARQHVTVTLSGDGGDELFGGYGSYLWAQKMEKLPYRLAAPFVYAATRFLNSRYQRAGLLFQKHPKGHTQSHIFSQSQYFFSEAELNNLLLTPTFDVDNFNHLYTGRKLSAFEQMTFGDIENYLKDDLLVKVDRASMQYSLETRVPLLDHRVVEFALNLPEQMKINSDGTMKHLLKEVLYQYVPKPLLDRPKWGFSIPLVKWLKTDLKWMIDKYCAKDLIERTGVVRYNVVKELIDRYQSGKADHLYNRIWTLIVLHWFFNEHYEKNTIHYL